MYKSIHPLSKEHLRTLLFLKGNDPNRLDQLHQHHNYINRSKDQHHNLRYQSNPKGNLHLYRNYLYGMKLQCQSYHIDNRENKRNNQHYDIHHDK